jgi:hypothetical protein
MATELNEPSRRIEPEEVLEWSIPRFQDFHSRFLKIVDSTDFGDLPDARPEGQDSPAHREIHQSNFKHLRNDRFVRKLHRIAKEYRRLQLARPQLPSVAEDLSRRIAINKQAEQALLEIVRELREKFVPNYVSDLRDPLRADVWAASEELENISYEFQKRGRHQADRIHPQFRKSKHDPSGRKPLIPDVNYDLPKTTKKAPRNWFYKAVDDRIRSSRNGGNLTEMTRLKLIAAAEEALTGKHVWPTAIKDVLHGDPSYKKKSDRA